MDAYKVVKEKMSDLVSIYLPTKNRVSLLKRAVSSVLSQTFRNIELIIVSDGSTDETHKYVESLKSDITIRFIHNHVSQGACAARNQAINASSGRFVTGLDDDDYFIPERIEKFISEWKKNEASGYKFSCLFDACMIDDGSYLKRHFDKPVVSEADIYLKNYIGSQIFSTKDNFLGAGLYDINMQVWQDWEFWVRVLNSYGPARNINICSYYVDASHDFDRITSNSSAKIIRAANLFYSKNKNVSGIIQALGNYPQVSLTLYDLIMSKSIIFFMRMIKHKRFIISLKSSISISN